MIFAVNSLEISFEVDLIETESAIVKRAGALPKELSNFNTNGV
jgi:hypothetical protein